jgi:hypothetical protein
MRLYIETEHPSEDGWEMCRHKESIYVLTQRGIDDPYPSFRRSKGKKKRVTTHPVEEMTPEKWALFILSGKLGSRRVMLWDGYGRADEEDGGAWIYFETVEAMLNAVSRGEAGPFVISDSKEKV